MARQTSLLGLTAPSPWACVAGRAPLRAAHIALDCGAYAARWRGDPLPWGGLGGGVPGDTIPTRRPLAAS